MSHYSSRILQTPPFVELYEVDATGYQMEPISIEPQLSTTPKNIRYSKNLSHAAFVYDFRRELVPGIGNPNESQPVGGIRVFSGDANWLLFGGTEGEQSAIYRRVGPGYQQFGAIPLPAAPNYVAHAVINRDATKLVMVTSDDLQTAKVFTRVGNQFTQTSTVASPSGDIVELLLTRLEGYVIVQGQTSFSMVSFLSGINLPNLPAGRVLAISHDDEGMHYVVDSLVSSELLRVFIWDEAQLTFMGQLSSTAGVNRRASFSNDNAVLSVSVANSAVSSYPLFFTFHEGKYRVVSGNNRQNSSTRTHTGFSFSRDSSAMLYSMKDGAEDSKVELYRRDSVVTSPVEAVVGPDDPASGIGLNAAFSPDGSYLAIAGGAGLQSLSIYRHDADGQLTRLEGVPNQANARSVGWSPDGTMLAVGLATTPYTAIFTRDGDVFTSTGNSMFRVALPTGEARSVKFSPDGSMLAVAHINSPFMTVYERNVTDGLFYKIPNPTSLPAGHCYGCDWSPDSVHLALAHGQSGSGASVYKRSGGTLTRLPSIIPSPTGSWGQAAFSPDGNYLAISTQNGLWAYARSGDTFTNLGVSFSEPIRALQFSFDSEYLAVTTNHGNRLALLRADGGDFARTEPSAPLYSAQPYGLAWSPDGRTIACPIDTSPFVSVYRWTGEVELPTYEMVEFVNTGSALRKLWGFSPDGLIAHFGSDGMNYHRDTADLAVQIEPLPFAQSNFSEDISNVLYSPDDRAVLFNSPDGPSVAIQTTTQGYLDLRDMRGTFVSIYHRESTAPEFKEVAFIAHPEDTRIEGFTFSINAAYFSYHAFNAPGETEGTEGRHIYGIQEGEVHRIAVDHQADMLKSFAAFSPHENYMVATYRRSGADNDIVLYKLDGITSADEVDREVVPFGPVDFSTCEDIIVAHGGENPFTIYFRDEDEMVLQPFPPIEWGREGLILDLAVLPDCSGFVVLLPDEIVVIDKQDDELTEESSDQTDETQDEDSEVETVETPGGGTEIVVRDPDGSGGGGRGGGGGSGGGHWEHTPGSGLTPLTYLPIISTHVHFRIR